MISGNTAMRVVELGLVPFRDGLRIQDDAVHARAAGEIPDTLLLLEHRPVLTAGRGTAADSVRADAATLAAHGIEVVPVSRGGDVTWHGPGQLVGYPICHLAGEGNDLHAFLRGLEQGLIDSLSRFGLPAHRIAGRTGVWVGDAGEEMKIASIGIAVRRWVTYHGFALNVCPDLSDFGLIHPCGLQGVRMTSMRERLQDACPALAEVREVVADEICRSLGHERVREGAAA